MKRLDAILQDNAAEVQRLKENQYSEDGKLKRNVMYGNECLKPLAKGCCLVWVGKEWAPGKDEDEDRWLMQQLSSMRQSAGDLHVHLQTASVSSGLGQDVRQRLVGDDEKSYALLAQAETVVSIGILPAIFHKRQGQRHVHLVTSRELVRTRYGAAAYGISCVLSADQILARTDDDLNRLVELYQLSNVFGGRLLVEDERQAGSAIASYLSAEQELMGHTLPDTGKKRIVLLHGCDDSDYRHRCFRQFLSSLDLDRFDVTVVLTKGKDLFETRAFLDTLDERVRAIVRLGTFSCDLESSVRTHLILGKLNAYDDPLQTVSAFPKGVWQGEWDRLLYGVAFAYLVSFERQSMVFPMLAASAHVGTKIAIKLDMRQCILQPNARDERRQAFERRAMLENDVFDVEVFANSAMMEAFEPYVPDCRCVLWDCCALFAACDCAPTGKSLASTELLGETYALLGFQNTPNRQHGLMLVLPPAEGTNYLTFCREEDAEHVVRDFLASPCAQGRLFVFVENDLLEASMERIPRFYDNVKFIGCEDVEDWKEFATYVALFDGYLLWDPEDRSRMRILCERVAVPCVDYDGNKLAASCPSIAKNPLFS